MVHDVVVIGASVAGLTAARRLAAEGFDVVVLDPNPEGASVAIGHGVAACAHASTVTTMSAAYGAEAVREHVRRNLVGMEEVRRVLAAGDVPHRVRPLHDHSLGVALDRELAPTVELLRSAGADVRLLGRDEARRPAAGMVSEALLVDPARYGAALAQQARHAGADIRYDMTITHLARRDGVTAVAVRPNLAWMRELHSMLAVAVVDTLGVSPWGRMAGNGPAQDVPVVRFRPAQAPDVVTLTAGPPVWLLRPVGDEAVAYGPKFPPAASADGVAELERFVTTRLGGVDLRSGTLTIDPSDHGRPSVGASPIPGGLYARGNGRGELMNGTASGTFLAALLMGLESTQNNALPMSSRLRASARGLRHRILGR